VSKINGVTLGSTTATSGNLLIGSGSQWVTNAISGDGTLNSSGSLIITKTNGVSFAASATTDTTNANNISSGTLGSGRLSGTYAITVSGTATNATNGATVSTTTNASYYPLIVSSTTNGNQAFNLSAGFSINPATNALSCNQIAVGASQTRAITTSASFMGANSTINNSANWFVSTDQYPNLQALPFSHDNVSLNFDSYYSGSNWTSSSASGSFQIIKNATTLAISYATGAAGSTISWTQGLIINTSGVVNIPGLTASSLVTTDSSKNLSSSNTLSSTVLGNIHKPNVVSYPTGSGTYVPTANCTHIKVKVWGAGGGGGGVAGAASNAGAAGGGGSGAYSESIINSPSGGGYSYSIGTGGAGGTAGANTGTTGGSTTFGGITAAGGAGGVGSTAGLSAAVVQGGLGGTATGGTSLNLNGGKGGLGVTLSSSLAFSGSGGAAPMGGGNNTQRISGSVVGDTGYSPGGGGSGAVSNNSNSRAGGDGADGLIIIEEYFNG
jgi:hypothetical protein